VVLVLLVLLVHKEILEQLDLREIPVKQVPKVHKEIQEIRGQLGQMALLVHKEILEQLVHKETQEMHQLFLDQLAQLDLLEPKVILVQLDHREPQETQEMFIDQFLQLP
jgi:hypothetical protein